MDTKRVGALRVKSEARGEVEAVFATLGVRDLDGDVTIPGAFTEGQEVRISAYGHSSWDGALPVGRGRITVRGNQAVMAGKFFLDTEAGRDTFAVVKHMGELQEWSYGFDVVDSEFGDHAGQRVRFLRRLSVHEVSPVLLGAAGPGRTRTLVAKSAARDHLSPGDRAELRAIAQLHEVRAIREAAHRRDADLRFRREQLAEAVRAGELIPYSEDLVRRPPLATFAPAWAGARWAVTELGVHVDPQIRWFSPEPAELSAVSGDDHVVAYAEQPLLGFCRPNADWTVWLRSDLPSRRAWAVAAHEVAHLAGHDEPGAVLFEAKAAAAYPGPVEVARWLWR
ncbi:MULTISPECIES: HK97 family phage prohead protease [unclassified Pseudonocardia]|uniref:HK97 family phage prohead protease n=1 Tax=unclassified Pseudonocardia TaxID=2619320 RepID=UPI0001FFE2C3|nr:HK97 family phage prohead protease [Pseudonocardia sp. Ae707_Ps1]